MRRRQINQQRQRRLTHQAKLVDNTPHQQSRELQQEIEQPPQYQPKLDGLSDPHSLSSELQMLESDEQILILEKSVSAMIDLLQLNQLEQSSLEDSVKAPQSILYPENGM